MVFLLFECTVESSSLRLNEEFTEYAWVQPGQLVAYDLNAATRKTFTAMGLLPTSDEPV
jgi:nucleoside triphosphatase